MLLARLDEGQPLKLSDVDLTQLVIETVSDEKVMAPDRTWHLELPEEPVVVRGDASQLHQVLANLLSNARKHTGPGTTVVTGVMRSADGSAVVTVTDDGAGIPPEFVDRVFARFARADAARATPAHAVLSPAGSGGHPVARCRLGSGCRRVRLGRGNQRPGAVHCAVDRGSPRRHGRGHLTARPDRIRRPAARARRRAVVVILVT